MKVIVGHYHARLGFKHMDFIDEDDSGNWLHCAVFDLLCSQGFLWGWGTNPAFRIDTDSDDRCEVGTAVARASRIILLVSIQASAAFNDFGADEMHGHFQTNL